MNAPWQELAAYAAVALAGLWLALRWARRRRNAKACDGCHAVTKAPRGRLHLPVVEPE